MLFGLRKSYCTGTEGWLRFKRSKNRRVGIEWTEGLTAQRFPFRRANLFLAPGFTSPLVSTRSHVPL
jgi:hypothetical protein